MLKNKKAVIFDLDGTLVDSMWMWRNIDIEYLARFNITIPEDLQRQIEGMSFLQTAVYFQDRFKIEDSVEDIVNEWNRMAMDYYQTKVPLKAGAGRFLAYLKKNNVKLGIATSNTRELTTAVLNALDIHRYFDGVITGSEVTTGKPAPYIYLEAAKNIEADPGDCLVFEDIPMGILSGKSAGMQVCAIEDDYSADMKEEKISLSDYFINDYNELMERII